MTPETLATLKALFSDPGGFRDLSAAQVRPEADYWAADRCAEQERVARVEETLLRVPRPAILYVTEVAHARAWGDHLKIMGFKRFGVFHGETPDNIRQQILNEWRGDALDLVVATSAFGLGIDHPHVRTIVHACVPETFDRFYQEVGRAGRDGRAALSVIIPAHSDFSTAQQINTRQVITIQRGRERWLSMFHHPSRRHLGGLRFRLRLDVAPGFGPDDIDLLSERGADWNARVLTLLCRAGLIRLLGSEYDPNSHSEESETIQPGKFETVEILDTRHVDETTWQERVEPVRQAIAAASRRNLGLMHRHIAGTHCPAELVSELYGPGIVDRICSNCQVCRIDGSARRSTDLRREPATPWPAPGWTGPLADLVHWNSRLVIPYDSQERGAFASRRTAETFQALYRDGLRCVVLLGEVAPLFERALRELMGLPIFVERLQFLAGSRLPDGSQLVLVGPRGRLELVSLAQDTERSRLLLIPRDYPDPEHPDMALLNRYPGPVIELDKLLQRLHR